MKALETVGGGNVACWSCMHAWWACTVVVCVGKRRCALCIGAFSCSSMLPTPFSSRVLCLQAMEQHLHRLKQQLKQRRRSTAAQSADEGGALSGGEAPSAGGEAAPPRGQRSLFPMQINVDAADVALRFEHHPLEVRRCEPTAAGGGKGDRRAPSRLESVALAACGHEHCTRASRGLPLLRFPHCPFRRPGWPRAGRCCVRWQCSSTSGARSLPQCRWAWRSRDVGAVAKPCWRWRQPTCIAPTQRASLHPPPARFRAAAPRQRQPAACSDGGECFYLCGARHAAGLGRLDAGAAAAVSLKVAVPGQHARQRQRRWEQCQCSGCCPRRRPCP